MISRKKFLLGTVAVVALGLMAGVVIGDRIVHKTKHYAEAAWVDVFDTPRALARGVDTIVLAQALETRPGRTALSANGEDIMPFQVTEFEVVHALRGASDYDHLVVERAGGVTPDGRTVVVDADGGEFETGRIYLLFLNQQEQGDYYFQVNHQGRFVAEGDHLLAASPEDNVAAALHGETVEQAVARVEGFLQNQRDRTPLAK
jgi:hypothetical protein